MSKISSGNINCEDLRIVEDELSLSDLIKVVWAGKWIVIFITIVLSVAVLVFVKSLPNIYVSSAMLTPSKAATSGGVSAAGSQFGGLASLAGISLGSKSENRVIIAMEIIKSREFFRYLTSKYEILPSLMAAESFDPISKKLKFNDNLYNEKLKKWTRPETQLRPSKPTIQESHLKFVSKVKINQNKKTSIITLAVEHISPVVAKEWASLIIAECNNLLREKDVKEASDSIRYLEAQLAKTSIAEMRSVFFQLIEEQIKTIMLAEAREEYVFSVIDEPVVPELKAKPNRTIICLVGGVVSIFIGIFIVLVLHAIKAGRKEKT